MQFVSIRTVILSFAPLAVLCSLSASAQILERGERFEAYGCYGRFEGGVLTIGNLHIERRWKVAGGRLFAQTLYDKDSRHEWLAHLSQLPSPTDPSDSGAPSGSTTTLRGGHGVLNVTEGPSLQLDLTSTAAGQEVHHHFQIFPDLSAIHLYVESTGPSLTQAATVPSVATVVKGAPPISDALEHLDLVDQHVRFTQVLFRDHTDRHDELVFENEWLLHPNETTLQLSGNLFTLEDVLTGDGLIFLKEAPEPDARPIPSPIDAWFAGSEVDPDAERRETGTTGLQLSFYGNGYQGSTGSGYKWSTIAYSGGRTGRIKAIHQFQRQLRKYEPARDGLLLSNTWGDLSGTSKINAPFVRAEIDAAKELGVDVVEVDDGWQSGSSSTLQKVGGAYEANHDFWKVDDKRFPAGLQEISQYARERGLKLGLWFAPDFNDSFASWQRDVSNLLRWHTQDGVDAFKLDMVRIESKKGEERYHRLLDTVLNDSSGNILLDLDVTAGTRQGYWGAIEAGPLFIENRFTDSHRYWPHQTLRNLWKLSQYVDPLRLRTEFLNSDRNSEVYGDDPLAPSRYRSDTLFATTMFGSPLAWLELSGLSREYIQNAGPLIATWKRERAALYSGTILPIGDVPDGVTWTGFASIAADSKTAYILAFRELNAKSVWTLPDGVLSNRQYRIEQLGGRGSAELGPHGLQISIPKTLDFVFLKLVTN